MDIMDMYDITLGKAFESFEDRRKIAEYIAQTMSVVRGTDIDDRYTANSIIGIVNKVAANYNMSLIGYLGPFAIYVDGEEEFIRANFQELKDAFIEEPLHERLAFENTIKNAIQRAVGTEVFGTAVWLENEEDNEDEDS